MILILVVMKQNLFEEHNPIMKSENLPGNVGKMEICWIWRIAAESEFG
jgi:hypothetical protein